MDKEGRLSIKNTHISHNQSLCQETKTCRKPVEGVIKLTFVFTSSPTSFNQVLLKKMMSDPDSL